MKIETLKKDNKMRIVIWIIAVISITLVGVFASSFAKYKLTQSIPLANGTIYYKAYDFKIMAMYQQKAGSTCTEDNCYDELASNARMPESGYIINETKSYCTIDNKNKDNNAKLYTNDNGEHVIGNLSKSDKCYLYFDKATTKKVNTVLGTLTVNIEKKASFTGVATTNEGIFEGTDDDGTTYYYRGAVTNNYLKFAGFWWRIIRINGDGTIRIIYDGTEYHANGTATSNSIALSGTKFNSKSDNAIYVGFKYGTTSQQRGTTNKSTILTSLETWYINNLASYTNRIDTSAGFCGDRTAYTGKNGGTSATGTGTEEQYFADYIRLKTGKAPVLTCTNNADLYTISGSIKGNKALSKPVGLINANEVSMAGGVSETINKSYYLYNGQDYWTMSPAGFLWYVEDDIILMTSSFFVGTNGNVSVRKVSGTYGVRPVINLRADVAITGSGTGEDPFVVN